MKKIIYVTAATIATFFMLPFLSAAAYADGGDYPEPEETVIVEEITLEESPPLSATEYEANPFTTSGTGTVIDYAGDADGKLFYTITTPDEYIFYLVIDKQRGTENVYFLNAVTVDDLLPLAENPQPPQGGAVTTIPPTTAPETPETPAPTPTEPEQQQSGSDMGMYIIIAVIVVFGGGLGWYFKIYRPKQQGAGHGEEYEPSMDEAETDYPGDWGDEQDGISDAASWDEDETDE